jgi:outer membrane protein OmpA-like peptidoglycan-associated protein
MWGRRAIVALSAFPALIFPRAIAAPAPPGVSTIPLCAGLTVVTAVSQSDGDYESIKTIETVGPNEVGLKYSSEAMLQDALTSGPPKLTKTLVHRRVLTSDLKSASLYEQIFYEHMPDQVPGTTAIGTSSSVLNALRSRQASDFGIFIAMTGEVSGARDKHPDIFDFQMLGRLTRVEPADVMVPVTVNGMLVQLPAIHASGDFQGDKTEFYFLDDPANPLTLKYRYGVGAPPSDMNSIIAALNNPKAPPRTDKDHFDVVKIAYRCNAPLAPQATTTPGAGQAPAASGAALAAANIEQQLAKTGKAEIYDIYFSFNSADIRPESEPSLKEIADVLGKHKDWKLNVAGHTDNIGGHTFNMGLSQRRSVAVKAALVARYHIDAGRLSTAGYGDTQPQDTNATLEGRARNRRVELSKL